jgi:hypothetical protein
MIVATAFTFFYCLISDDDEEEITESHVQVVDYLLHNPEFDMILDAIEQDLESTAGGKNGTSMTFYFA